MCRRINDSKRGKGIKAPRFPVHHTATQPEHQQDQKNCQSHESFRLWNTLHKLSPARLSKRERRVFAITATAGIFNDYDGQLVNLAIGQIQQSLKLTETSLAPMVSVIQLGTLGAPLLTAQADRFGRRRLLILTILGYTLFTGITALAWNGVSFAIFRFGATLFSSAEG